MPYFPHFLEKYTTKNSCFFQDELDQIALEWNIHKVRKTKNAIGSAGRPAVMYEMPSLYGCDDYLLKIPSFAIDALQSECLFIETPCDKDFHELCCLVMEENNLIRPCDPYSGIDFYVTLRNKLLLLFQ